MVHFDFSISSFCNAACPSCKRYLNYNDPKIIDDDVFVGLVQTHMKFDDFKKIIDENIDLFENKIVSYEGEFGDPMVNPEVLKFIEYGCKFFKTLKVVTNGGMRNSKFYKELGNNFQNLDMIFSIDGLHDDTNTRYRRRVNTEKAKENMVTFKKTTYGRKNLYWQFLIFEHNFFEIPEILDFAKEYEICISLKLNTRPKFKLHESKIEKIVRMYEKNKFENSSLLIGN
jgi:MoaA/NifB/PqqE/SkfB family radical SAM enzyme